MDIKNIEEKKLYEFIKSAVIEAVREELLNYKLNNIPFADPEEMKDIQKDLKEENDYKNQEYRKLKI